MQRISPLSFKCAMQYLILLPLYVLLLSIKLILTNPIFYRKRDLVNSLDILLNLSSPLTLNNLMYFNFLNDKKHLKQQIRQNLI